MNLKPFSLKFHLVSYCLLLLIGTIVFNTTDLDLIISDQWYFTEDQWVGTDHPFWGFIYIYLTGPNIFTLYLAIVTLIYAKFISGNQRAKWAAFCVVIAIVIGPGLLVNGILKPTVGRPRPYLIERYDGSEQYVKLLHIGKSGKSFPSGHASSGFVLTILFYIWFRKRKKLAWFCWFSGLGMGILLSIGRIAQGGHFASDTLWAFGITQLVNCLVYFKLEPKILGHTPPPQRFAQADSKSKATAVSLIGVSTGLFLVGYLVNFPFTFHETGYHRLPGQVNKLVITADLGDEVIRLYDRNDRIVGFDHLAFANGFPWSDSTPETSIATSNQQLTYSIRVERKGFFRDYRGRMKLFLPQGMEIDLSQVKGKEIIDHRK